MAHSPGGFPALVRCRNLTTIEAAEPAWFTQAITPVKILLAQVSTRGSQVLPIS